MLSVVIPVYNSEKYVHRCLDSIIQQSYDDFEVVIVDDGSTDNSRRIVEKYISQDPRIQYYYINNHGVSYARNYGIDRISGKYLLFCDIDDYYATNYFSEMLSLIERTHTNIAMCNFYLVHGKDTYPNKIPNLSGEGVLNSQDALHLILLDNGFKGFVWNKIYRTGAINAHRFDDGISYLEDLLFNVLAFMDNDQISYSTQCLYYYCQNSGSASSRLNQDFYDSLLRIRKVIPMKSKCVTDANLLYSLVSDHKEYSDLFNLIRNENKARNLKLHNPAKNFIVKVSFINPTIATLISDILKKFLTSNLYFKLRRLSK